ncbi:MAG: PAS domain-containing protein [Sulfuritalea sp.]|jgi:chemotaxis methyl-accepting protein methylase|nr:PAS domain-containing protein [Sulfuritalea sp.]
MARTAPPSKPKATRPAQRIAKGATTPVKRAKAGVEPGSEPAARPFAIVAIGASAGGLDALEQFLGHVPAGSGMAFVVIQHLDPNHKGMMPELLQRATAMPVAQAKNRMKVKPDCVYVIPPNRDLSILHDTLHLLELAAPRGLRLPIDFFFRALADDRREQAIGVILSGMGSDGTLGLRAIKEKGGLVLVQDPATAKFDSMPKSAIDAGLADIVAAAEELPQRIIDTLRYGPRPATGAAEPEAETLAQKSGFDKISILLRARTGHDFSLYKKTTVYRRIERRMAIHQIKRIADYVRYLRENPQEVDLLFKELLIGVTSFFRDPAIWAYLQEQALPALLAASPDGGALRAWVAGCSTGEEAYSLAIAFREVQERLKLPAHHVLQIFATDLDPDAIAKARQGFYPANIAADVAPQRLKRFFVQDGNGYRVAKEIREMVVFAPQNVVMDPPFTKLDILTCRNLLIYLGPELQKKLLPLFHYSLKPGGLLMLGSAESIGGFTDLFTPLEGKARLFWRSSGSLRAFELEFPTRHLPINTESAMNPKPKAPAANLQNLADQLLLQQFSPAAVLVTGAGDVVYISGRTGKYLEPAAGKANWNIHAMAREGLRQELALALPKALRSGQRVICRNLSVGTNGGTQQVDLTVNPVMEPAALQGMAMVVFADVDTPQAAQTPDSDSGKAAPRTGRRVAELEQALAQARQEIQALREEMQTSQEELKSSNEEMQSTNEELQSTNEELTTSKEEMQSLNEELQTVNLELQSKVDELSSINNDMKNLLNSTDMATVFLDNVLHVRRFTTQATRLFKLLPGDVGRPLSDIASDLVYPGLLADAAEVLNTLAFSEREIATGDGRWFQVKIMPYRTLENVIDGVVITLNDIGRAKRLEAELRAIGGKAKEQP